MKKEVQALLKRRRQRRVPMVLASIAGVLLCAGLATVLYLLIAGPVQKLLPTATPTASSTFTPLPPSDTPTETASPFVTLTSSVTLGPPLPITYTVQSGETLYSIARQFEVDFCLLLAVNQITNPDFVAVGQALIIPGGDEKLPTATPLPDSLGRGAVIKYTVQCGDSIQSIAAAFNSTTEDILKRNKIKDPTALTIGQVIEVRVKLVTPTPLPTVTSTPSPTPRG